MSFHVEHGYLKAEEFTKTRSEQGYWLLGYRAEFPEPEGGTRVDRIVEVAPGGTEVTTRDGMQPHRVGYKGPAPGSMVVRNEQEARVYIHCMDLAKRACEWNAEAPKEVWSHEQAIEAIHALVEWAKSGTSARSLSHHGIRMSAPILVGGFPVRLDWSGTTNAIYAYEKHWDLPDVARRPWDLAGPGPEARELVERAGLTVVDEWNHNRSMRVNLEMHPSVAAAFCPSNDKKKEIGEPLQGAPEVPEGWGASP